MKLEELARQSSTAARVSVAHLEATPMATAPRNRPGVPLLAALAATALVVGGLAVLARDRASDPSAPADSVLPTVSEVPRLGVELDGWSVTFAAPLDDLNGEVVPPNFVYYGNADSDDPFADGDLVIAAYSNADGAPASDLPTGGETVDVRGTTATVSSGADQGLPVDATSITWTERDADGAAAEVVLVSQSFDIDQLAQIAEELSIDVVGARVSPGADLGLERVAAATGTPFDAMRGAGEGYVVAYQNGDGSDYVIVNTARGDVATEAAALRWWAATLEDVDVGGRPGFLASFPESSVDLGSIVTWSTDDGVIATISHLGTDDSVDVVALAGSAFEVDDATWATYQTASQASQAGADDFDEIFGQSDGVQVETEYSWVLGVQGEDLCFNMQVGKSGTGSCQPLSSVDAPDGGARTLDNSFGDTIAHVVIVADPAVDDVIETTGSYTVDRVEAAGNSWFIAIGDTNVQPSFDVIVDGAIVDTLEAGVEAAAEIEPALSENSAAAELGLIDMQVIASDGPNPDFTWMLGRNGDDLCLVTEGVESSAFCSRPADVVVAPPVAGPEGQMTFIVVTDVPTCVETIDVVGPVTDLTASTGDEQHSYEVLAVVGESDGWTMRFGGAAADEILDLPSGRETADFPPGLCGG